ncbi:MAG TPA: hypothetical protein PKA33_05365 [Amaricoccus sp.]|uniref:hypothetical protein n=1 Tax=Amaricoccus sp. TaxID=1872485 RepID=UPI002C7F7D88|nr:hypothetical protein [Amaricoccus sp.]HMQ93987.1 hypothetical protein [Amaricoccus sp.]HMR51985.1 hypothetical protein [Amaricoccus sp.]HMT98787.1 hypothetical protein [Amaricoccus sp.]
MLKYLMVWYEREQSAVLEAEALISEFGRLAGPVAWLRSREAGLDRKTKVLRRMVAREVGRILTRQPERAAGLVVDRDRLARLTVSGAAREIAAAGGGLGGSVPADSGSAAGERVRQGPGAPPDPAQSRTRSAG